MSLSNYHMYLMFNSFYQTKNLDCWQRYYKLVLGPMLKKLWVVYQFIMQSLSHKLQKLFRNLSIQPFNRYTKGNNWKLAVRYCTTVINYPLEQFNIYLKLKFRYSGLHSRIRSKTYEPLNNKGAPSPVKTFEEFRLTIVPMLLALGPFSADDPVLLYKTLRILKSSLGIVCILCFFDWLMLLLKLQLTCFKYLNIWIIFSQMTKEEKKKTNLSIRIRPVCILMFLPLWTKYTCLLYHCQKETVVWQKKYGLFYAYTHTIVDIGKNSWKIDIPIMSV